LQEHKGEKGVDDMKERSFSEKLNWRVKLEMIYIPGGSFLMGYGEYGTGRGDTFEHPQHHVTVSPFYLGKYPVTQGQWQAIMGSNPSRFKSNKLPVENVSWHDAVKFCDLISNRTGKSYRLPTEVEWEYACRAGSDKKYCFDNDEFLLLNYAWFRRNSDQKTHPVGLKKPNAWGLYDMHGNIWEWCGDDWHWNYDGAPTDGRAWIDVPLRGSGRVSRGGSWYTEAAFCRASFRNHVPPDDRGSAGGFRLALG
jgi:formylglycine-generating enzyme required for sulfatase activity